MKKTLSILIGLLFLASFVIADTYVDIGVDTEDDLYAYIELEAGGDMDVTVDGVNLGEHYAEIRQSISDSRRSMSSIYWNIADVFMRLNQYKDRWEYTDVKDLTPEELNLRKVFDMYFVPRQEFNTVVSSLELEILTLKSIMTEEQLCEARKEIAIRYDFGSIECNGQVLHKLGDDEFIILSPIEPTDEEIKEKEWQEKLKEMEKLEEIQRLQEKMLNNTQSYIDIICSPDDGRNWTNGKCLEVNK